MTEAIMQRNTFVSFLIARGNLLICYHKYVFSIFFCKYFLYIKEDHLYALFLKDFCHDVEWILIKVFFFLYLLRRPYNIFFLYSVNVVNFTD